MLMPLVCGPPLEYTVGGYLLFSLLPLPGGSVKNLPTMQELWVQSLGRENPLEKETATHSRLPGESHRKRSLTGYSPWRCKETEMTATNTLLPLCLLCPL